MAARRRRRYGRLGAGVETSRPSWQSARAYQEVALEEESNTLALGALLTLAACASSGVDPHAAAHFKPGVTTRTEVIKRLGPPASVYDGTDETKTLTWAKSGGLFDSGSTKGLSIQYGADDKMEQVASQP